MNDKKKGPGGPESSEGDIVPTDPQTVSFVRGLVARGQAARADASGNLPPGVTHEIVGETAAGEPILRRRRFGGMPGPGRSG
jgi:hypothetical protein